MLRAQLEDVRRRMQQACQRSGRPPSSVTLVAVTKTVEVEIIREAVALGIRDLGENRVQEALAKHAQLAISDGSLRWHLIGHLQRNKAKLAAALFDAVHSVDSLLLMESLDTQAAASGRTQPLDCFIQVNVSGETTKHGAPPDQVPGLATALRGAQHVRLAGFMTMAPWSRDPEEARPHFRRLRQLRDAIDPTLKLSMGMSGDFEVAIEEGADYIRVGTAIFGARGMGHEAGDEAS